MTGPAPRAATAPRPGTRTAPTAPTTSGTGTGAGAVAAVRPQVSALTPDPDHPAAAPARPDGDDRAPGAPYRGSVLRTVTWLIRAVAFVLIGIDTFVQASASDRTALVVTAVGYALSGVALAGWGLLDHRVGAEAARASRLLPFLLAAMAVASGFASAYAHGSSLPGLAMIAVIAAGSETPLATGWTVAACGVLAIEAGALVTGAGRGVILGYPLLVLVALLAGHNRGAYRVRADQNAVLLAKSEQLRTEQRRAAVLDERARIAREIHDVLAHSLGALNIQIQTARALLAHDEPGRADDILATAQRLSTEGLVETRRAVQALRTDVPPLPEALTAMAESHRQQHHSPVDLTVDGSAGPLPPEQILCLVRTAQEALTNAAKHAPGRPVALALHYEDHDVTLTVSNPLGDARPGAPAFATVNGGYGLTGMRERLLLIGGTLTAGPQDDRWTVTARAPR
ncbi:sensor histidine kinase [Streptacidiphilus sp. PB12-B1b]|uniref:sensor histidine kinase n=1 Tax=Streptacidiphilus sp. PB12-B1b TaxID=2705012 RepID=UPI0015F8595E|nr:sensor histidine kinase [Streptacidiphilus sp. PB12-B1b]QMU74956.1 sensor histidine kinase [Streptacidiphilus sp. PB12-B1b]